MGCATDAVSVNVTFLGGSFGRKIVPDYVVQAVQASKAVGRPVKLIRTREEDTQHDVFRPNAGARIRAVLDEAGYPLAVHARVAGQSLFGATRKSWLDRTPDSTFQTAIVQFYEACVQPPLHADRLLSKARMVRHALTHLLNCPDPLPRKLERCLNADGDYFTPGLGATFWSVLVQTANPERYPGWTPGILAGAERLGLLASRAARNLSRPHHNVNSNVRSSSFWSAPPDRADPRA